MNQPPSVPYAAMRDDNHLRLLVLFHYLLGILEILGGLFLLGVAILMTRMFKTISTLPSTVPPPAPVTLPGATPAPSISTPPTPPPAELMEGMSNIMLFSYGGMAVAALILAVLTLISARGMATRKWETLSLVVAGCQCLVMPLGTVLGIFTFIVLLRPTVAAQYQQNRAPSD